MKFGRSIEYHSKAHQVRPYVLGVVSLLFIAPHKVAMENWSDLNKFTLYVK